MINCFEFQLNNRLFYGIGASRKLGDLIMRNGWRSAALVVDRGLMATSYYATILASVEAAARTFILPVRSEEEPSYDYLDELADEIRSLPVLDVVVAIGGGSAMDAGKALACLRTNPGRSIYYRGFDKVTIAPVPSVCVPTTAGTGSEVTINAVFTDKSEMRKLGINGRYLHSTFAILDAEWTLSCPQHVAISSGMDALVHTLESFMTTNANPLTRALNREALVILYRNLPSLIEVPGDIERRQLLLLGAYLAAAGLFNSGSGVAGAMSYPIGVHYKVPHGIAGGILIASIVEYNVSAGYYEFADLLDIIEPHPDWEKVRKARRFAELIRALSDHLGVPRTFGKWGISRSNVEDVVKLMHPMQAAFNQNPIPFHADRDARAILLQHTE